MTAKRQEMAANSMEIVWRRRYRGLTATAALGLFVLLPGAVSLAQTKDASPAASGAPAAPSAPAATPTEAPGKKRTVTFTITRAGSYSLFIPGLPAGLGQFSAGDKPSVSVDLAPSSAEADVVDQTEGTIAITPIAGLKDGAKVDLSPADFKYIAGVTVTVTSSGKPVAAAAVTLTGADGKPRPFLMSAPDDGIAKFKNVPVGKATVTVASNAGGPKTTQEVVIAPTKGGTVFDIPVTLAGNVPTLDKPAAPAVAAAPGALPAAPAPAPEPPPNNWIPGVIGIILLAAGVVYGIRYLKNRGVTVEDALKKMGVEMPQDGAGGTLAAPLKPAAPPLPPLPSLTDLPPAGAAAGAAVSNFSVASANPPGGGGTAVRTAPRLIGLGGAVSGEEFPLEAGSAFSVGRDDGNSLALTQDKAVSRRHARVERSGDGWAVVDEGSSNGTYVNGAKVAGSTALRSGDEIQIGGARFRFEG